MFKTNVTVLQRGEKCITVKPEADGSQERTVVDLMLEQDGQGSL